MAFWPGPRARRPFSASSYSSLGLKVSLGEAALGRPRFDYPTYLTSKVTRPTICPWSRQIFSQGIAGYRAPDCATSLGRVPGSRQCTAADKWRKSTTRSGFEMARAPGPGRGNQPLVPAVLASSRQIRHCRRRLEPLDEARADEATTEEAVTRYVALIATPEPCGSSPSA